MLHTLPLCCSSPSSSWLIFDFLPCWSYITLPLALFSGIPFHAKIFNSSSPLACTSTWVVDSSTLLPSLTHNQAQTSRIHSMDTSFMGWKFNPTCPRCSTTLVASKFFTNRADFITKTGHTFSSSSRGCLLPFWGSKTGLKP